METDIELAYIQKRGGEFINMTAYTAWEGFKLLGIPTEFFESKQLDNGWMPVPLSKTTLVCGYIGAVEKALKEIGAKKSTVEDYPKELESFLGRRVWQSTLGEVRKDEPRCFIKPKQSKLFNGHVRTGLLQDVIQTAMCPDETEVYCSESVKIISEWRVFVNNGLMIGCQPYLGDFTLHPDFDTVTNCINSYKSAPVGYSADFGVTDYSRTILIEINDAYSLGCYGLPSMPYANLIKDRWIEIVNA